MVNVDFLWILFQMPFKLFYLKASENHFLVQQKGDKFMRLNKYREIME